MIRFEAGTIEAETSGSGSSLLTLPREGETSVRQTLKRRPGSTAANGFPEITPVRLF
jgi:hypothetical protein